jgi:hypothetical protein
MKKLLLALLCGMVLAPAALAGTVRVNDGPGSPGGIYNVVTSDNGSFQTFCVERREYLNLGATYYYEISNAVRFDGGPIGTFDPISRATAWLFVNFRTAVPGYADDAFHNNAIQNAIWCLEGDVTPGSLSAKARDYYNAAIAGAGPNWASDANGAFGVYVMNLNTTNPGTYAGRRQDLLIQIQMPEPVAQIPDGGLTVMLLGLAIGCLSLISRKLGR